MNFSEAISSVFNKYATFSGRARRSEYWYFYLLNLLVSLGIGFIPFINLLSPLWALAVLIPTIAVAVRRFHDIGKSGYWLLLMMLPGVVFSIIFFIFIMQIIMDTNTFGLNVEDLEDYDTIIELVMNHSSMLIAMGASLILSIITGVWQLVWLVFDSEPGENQYGPNPKETIKDSDNKMEVHSSANDLTV